MIVQTPKTVLVTGIGGHVGQGILRNLRAFEPSLRIVGTDIAASTAGHHYCDAFQRVPYAYDPAYPAAIEGVCVREAIDLIIPATDYETYHLALIRDRLPTLLGSPAGSALMCLDKYATAVAFRERGIPFVDTVLPSGYGGEWGSIVVKPREGRGSHGVHIDPEDWRRFNDRAGQLVGAFEIRGPCNIQSIASDEGPIPFDLNSRYSAISAFSSQFGFEAVRYAVEEYLLGVPVSPPNVGRGCVHRLLVDEIYPDQAYDGIAPGSARSYIFAGSATSAAEGRDERGQAGGAGVAWA